MKRTALTCSLFLAMAIAVTAAAPGSPKDKTVPRDLSGVLVGTFTFDVWGGGWYDFTTNGDATGKLKHLGLAKLYTSHTPNPIGDGTLVDTEFTIVAANGDKIWGTYSDGVVTEVPRVPPPAPSDQIHYYDGRATFVISGGTGRFAHARGKINATVFEALDWATWNCTVAWALEGKDRD
jgi:hypothetical protein